MINFGNNVDEASGVTFINHDVSAFMLRYMEFDTKFNAQTDVILFSNNVVNVQMEVLSR